MPHYTYILFSSNINKFYVGFTSLKLDERIRRHNSNHKGFTGKTNDWEIVWKQEFLTKTEALKKEKAIKKRGAKRFLKDLE
jgi:putative endonuclease